MIAVVEQRHLSHNNPDELAVAQGKKQVLLLGFSNGTTTSLSLVYHGYRC